VLGVIGNMHSYRFILIVSTLGFITCNSKNGDTPLSIEKKQQYTFIRGVIEKSDSTYLEVDYIQYLTGDSAIAAAKRMGDLDTFQTADGITHEDVPNDYYILNESKKLRRIPIANECKYDLLLFLDRIKKVDENSLASLKRIYDDSPFLLTISNGEVIEVKEVFVP
jgi:hypothetical protein